MDKKMKRKKLNKNTREEMSHNLRTRVEESNKKEQERKRIKKGRIREENSLKGGTREEKRPEKRRKDA